MSCMEEARAKLEAEMERLDDPVVRMAADAADAVAELYDGQAYINTESHKGRPWLRVEVVAEDPRKVTAEVLRMLAGRGFHRDRRIELYETGRRMCHTLLANADTDEEIQLNVYVGVAGGACRWVQKGVRREPVYELVCDEA